MLQELEEKEKWIEKYGGPDELLLYQVPTVTMVDVPSKLCLAPTQIHEV